MKNKRYSNEFFGPALDVLTEISNQLAGARAQATGLIDFPGVLPKTLEEAYYIQDQLIKANGRNIAGWKVGRINEPVSDTLIDQRFSGPIFDGTVVHYDGGITSMPAIEGGLALIEAELMLETNADIMPGQISRAELGENNQALNDYIDTISIGIEIAGTTLANLGALGPIASICDSGTNVGLLVGPKIDNWRDVALTDIPCAVAINDTEVGSGTADNVPGGYLAAFAFLIDVCDRRNITLPKGTLVSSGAITGVHPIPIGGHSCCDFGPFGQVEVEMVRKLPDA